MKRPRSIVFMWQHHAFPHARAGLFARVGGEAARLPFVGPGAGLIDRAQAGPASIALASWTPSSLPGCGRCRWAGQGQSRTGPLLRPGRWLSRQALDRRWPRGSPALSGGWAWRATLPFTAMLPPSLWRSASRLAFAMLSAWRHCSPARAADFRSWARRSGSKAHGLSDSERDHLQARHALEVAVS